METGLINKILEEEKEAFTCNICYMKKENLVLCPKCGKGFCESCFQKMLKSKREKYCTCPFCKVLSEVKSFLKSGLVGGYRNFEEVCKYIQNQKKNLCNIHKLPKTYFCETCKKEVCSDCLIDKQKGHTPSKKHSIVKNDNSRFIKPFLSKLEKIMSERNIIHRKLNDEKEDLKKISNDDEKEKAIKKRNICALTKKLNIFSVSELESLIQQLKNNSLSLPIKIEEIDKKINSYFAINVINPLTNRKTEQINFRKRKRIEEDIFNVESIWEDEEKKIKKENYSVDYLISSFPSDGFYGYLYIDLSGFEEKINEEMTRVSEFNNLGEFLWNE